MTKQLRPLFSLFLGLLFLSNLKGQTSESVQDTTTRNPSLDISTRTLWEISNLYPIVVSEITTNDGLVIRGDLFNRDIVDNKEVFLIGSRLNGRQAIPIEDVKEIALVNPNRSERNTFSEYGYFFGPSSETGAISSAGAILGIGYEMFNSSILLVNSTHHNMYNQQGDSEYNFLGIETLFGKRLNRHQSNIHTVGAGLGLFLFMEPWLNTDFALLGHYDYDIKITNGIGVSLFTKFYFFPLQRSSLLVFGCSYRIYDAAPRRKKRYLNLPQS
ncbi:MAG: hypothetical protein LAT76_09850 [Schleiferiaceae bacterium]|nr:hypothetical protein [Schleiferiaceae bacterium]